MFQFMSLASLCQNFDLEITRLTHIVRLKKGQFGKFSYKLNKSFFS